MKVDLILDHLKIEYTTENIADQAYSDEEEYDEIEEANGTEEHIEDFSESCKALRNGFFRPEMQYAMETTDRMVVDEYTYNIAFTDEERKEWDDAFDEYFKLYGDNA